MFNKSLIINDNQLRKLTTEAYKECYELKIPYSVDRDDADSMFTLSFPSENAYEDFMTFIYKPFLRSEDTEWLHLTIPSKNYSVLILLALVQGSLESS